MVHTKNEIVWRVRFFFSLPGSPPGGIDYIGSEKKKKVSNKRSGKLFNRKYNTPKNNLCVATRWAPSSNFPTVVTLMRGGSDHHPGRPPIIAHTYVQSEGPVLPCRVGRALYVEAECTFLTFLISERDETHLLTQQSSERRSSFLFFSLILDSFFSV